MIREPEHRWNVDDDPTRVPTEHPRWPTGEDFAEASAERRAMDHRFDVDSDRCRCGGQVVYHEDGDQFGEVGEGCEIGGVWPVKCKICREPITAGQERAEMYDPAAEMALVEMGEADGIVHAQCGISRGWEVS